MLVEEPVLSAQPVATSVPTLVWDAFVKVPIPGLMVKEPVPLAAVKIPSTMAIDEVSGSLDVNGESIIDAEDEEQAITASDGWLTIMVMGKN